METHLVQRHRLTNLLHTALLIGGMALLVIAIGYMLFGTKGVIWAGLLGVMLSILSPKISPRMVLGMYRAKYLPPASAPQLYEIVAELARRARLERVPRLYYVPSRMLNAFSVGNRADAAIGVTDGLLRRLNLRELTGVLAHEVAHVFHHDIKVMNTADLIGRITRAFSFFGQIMLLINLPLLLSGSASLPLLPIILLILAPNISALLQLALSRTREFDADLGAVKLTGDPDGLANALQKLEWYQGGFLSRILFPGRKVPDPSLIRTHPATQARVKRLRSLKPDRIHTPPLRPEGDLAVPGAFSEIRRRPKLGWHGFWF